MSKYFLAMNTIYALVAAVLIFGSTPVLSQGKEMQSMTEALQGTNWNKPDSSTIGFIGTRCGVLFTAISGYFASNAIKDSERKTAEDFKSKGEIFSLVGVHVDINKNNKSDKAIKAQHQALSKNYIDEMLSGKRLNNDVFTKLVVSDVEFCVKQFPAFVHANKILLDTENKNRK